MNKEAARENIAESKRAEVLKFKEFAGILDKELRCRNIAAVTLSISRDYDEDLGALYFNMQGCTEHEEQLVRANLVHLNKDKNLREVPWYCRLLQGAQ